MKKTKNYQQMSVIVIAFISMFVWCNVSTANDGSFYSLHVDKLCLPDLNQHLYLPGVADLYVPNGALDEEKQIGMTVSFWWNNDDPDFMVEFSPHGTIFNVPVRLTLSLLMSRLFVGDEVGIYYFDENYQEWILIDVITITHPGQRVSIELEHFSVYAFSKIKNGN